MSIEENQEIEMDQEPLTQEGDEIEDSEVGDDSTFEEGGEADDQPDSTEPSQDVADLKRQIQELQLQQAQQQNVFQQQLLESMKNRSPQHEEPKEETLNIDQVFAGSPRDQAQQIDQYFQQKIANAQRPLQQQAEEHAALVRRQQIAASYAQFKAEAGDDPNFGYRAVEPYLKQALQIIESKDDRKTLEAARLMVIGAKHMQEQNEKRASTGRAVAGKKELKKRADVNGRTKPPGNPPPTKEGDQPIKLSSMISEYAKTLVDSA